MSKESRQVFLLVVLLVVGVSYAYYTYLFTPKWADIQTLKGMYQQRQSRYELLLGYSGQEAYLSAEIKNLEKQSEELWKQIPSAIHKPDIVVELYTIAKQNQVEPLHVSFGETQGEKDYIAQRLVLNCRGSQEQITKLINDLQSANDQRFTLASLNFVHSEGVLNGEIHLIAYASTVKPAAKKVLDEDYMTEEQQRNPNDG